MENPLIPNGRERAIETLIDLEPHGAFYRAARVMVRSSWMDLSTLGCAWHGTPKKENGWQRKESPLHKKPGKMEMGFDWF
jgi:hypothetical protein